MRYTFILGGLCFSAFTLAQVVDPGKDHIRVGLQGRQNADSLPLSSDDATPGTALSQLSATLTASSETSIITSSSSAILASSTTANSASTTTWTTLTTTGPPYWGVTTTFTQPTACIEGISRYPNISLGLFQNIIEPIPKLTLTSCYPDAFLASATATVDTPPYEQIICPYQWENYVFNETYVICCPSAYGLFAPGWASNTQRPGLGAVCTSGVGPGIYIDVTEYLPDGLVVVTGTTVTSSGPLPIVFATAFDGTRAGAISSGTQATPTGTSAASLSDSQIPSSSSTGSATTAEQSSSASENSGTKVTSSSSATATTPSTTPQPANTSESGATSELATASELSSLATTSQPASTTSSAPDLTTTTQWTGPTAISQLPSCGQTCFHNMLGQYSQLGCTTDDPACLCHVANFGYGIRDCSNGACGTSVGSSVISFASSYYCPSAMAARTTFPATAAATPTAISELPACGQTCFHNMLAQYSDLGCSSPEAACLCGKINFFYGIRDCSNGACGAAVASTVISFESRWCASATAAPQTTK